MKTAVIYTRVSTEDQDCDRQIRDLTEFAHRAGYEVVQVFSEKASGTKNNRAERAKVIQLARQRKIDAILVTELSRWGRSTEDLLATVGDLANWGVSLIAQTGMQFDINSPSGKLMLTMLAGFAEFERALINERVRSGVKAAQAKGVKFGRPAIGTYQINKLLDAGKSFRAIATELDISPTTVQKISKERKHAQAV
jgi:DNA invertase Pin-like site-specific DNA recombinase